MESNNCHFCGEVFRPEGCTTGYGTDGEGRRVCFACCGWSDAIALVTGRARPVLYLVQDGRACGGHTLGMVVTNWPGTLKVKPERVRHGKAAVFGRVYPALYFTFTAGPNLYKGRLIDTPTGGQAFAPQLCK